MKRQECKEEENGGRREGDSENITWHCARLERSSMKTEKRTTRMQRWVRQW